MNFALTDYFVKNGVLSPETEILSQITIPYFDGIQEHIKKRYSYIVDSYDCGDHYKFRVNYRGEDFMTDSNTIEEIGGMRIKRICQAYYVDENGKKRKPKKYEIDMDEIDEIEDYED